jgi:hypothetical protein
MLGGSNGAGKQRALQLLLLAMRLVLVPVQLMAIRAVGGAGVRAVWSL